jgi:hypothetical protein
MVSGRRRHVDPAMQPQRLDELVDRAAASIVLNLHHQSEPVREPDVRC